MQESRNFSLILILIFVNLFALRAEEFFWVNNAGNWSDFANHWQDSSGVFYNRLPTDTDNVYFNASSFNLNGQVVVIDVSLAEARNIDFTGITNNPQIQGAANDTVAVYGSLKFASGLTNNYNGIFDFKSDGVDSVFSFGASFAGDVHFTGNGKLILGDAADILGGLYLMSGEFRTNDEDLDISYLWSNLNQTRKFSGGKSIIYVKGSGQVWNINDVNFTIEVDSCFLILDHNTDAEVIFNTGGSLVDYNSMTINSPNTYIPESGKFGQLTVNPGVFLKLLSGGLYTITNMFAAGACDNQIIIQSDAAGVQTLISQSAGTVSGNYMKLKDINAGGGATFNAFNSIDEGNVNGWSITAPTGPSDLYWIGGTGNWNNAANWSASSGGAPASCIPGPSTNVFFDANSFQSNGDSVIIDYNAYCNNMDWSAATLNPVLSGEASYKIEVNGSLTMIVAMQAPFSGKLNFVNTGSKTLNTNGLPLEANVHFADNGTWDIQSDFICNSYVSLEEGVLNSNGNSLTLSAFYSSTQQTRSIDFSNSIIDITGDSLAWNIDATNLTTNFSNSRISLIYSQLSPVVFSGAGLQYNQLMLQTKYTELNGSNQFNLLSIDPGNVLTLEAGSNTDVDSLSATGNCNEQITIETLTALAPPAIITKTGFDTLLVDYCIINNVEADISGGQFNNATNSELFYSTSGWTADTLTGSNTFYWISGTGFWDDSNHWSLTSGGTPAACMPGIRDTVIFDQNSGSPASVTVRQDAFCAFMDWTDVGGNPDLELYRNIYIRQGAFLSPNMTLNVGSIPNSFSSKLVFLSDSNNVYFDPAGVNINSYVYYDAAQLSDTLFLLNNLIMDSSFAGFVMLSGTFQSNSNDILASRVIMESSNAKLLHIENSNIDVSAGWDAQNAGSSLTVNAQNSLIRIFGTQAPGFFYGADADYYDLIIQQVVNDTIFMTGNNSFNRVDIDAGVLLAVEGGSTQQLSDSLVAVGTCFDSISIVSMNPGNAFVFLQVNSKVHGECLNLQDFSASGSVNFPALFSTDLGGNSGWDFLNDKTSDPDFIFPSFDVCPGDTIVFTNSTTAFDGDTSALSIEWDFDDGSTSQLNNPTHLYSGGGVYNIQLSSTYRNGCKEIFTDSVRVNELNLTLSTTSNLTICEGDEVTFYLSDQASQYRFLNNDTVVKPFSTDTFYVTNTLEDGDSISAEYTSNGCTFTAVPVLVLNVNPAPVLNFGTTDTNLIICDGDQVDFFANGADNYQFYIDSLTVGFFGPDSTISISNLNDGESVRVEGTTDSSGCSVFSDTAYTFTVYPNPVVNLITSANPQIICENEPVTFTASGADFYEFYVNGQLAYGQSVDSTYITDSLSNGDEVYAIGYTNNCPTQSGSFTFLVNPNPNVILSNNSTNNEVCEGVQITFSANGAAAYQFFVDGIAVTPQSVNNIYSTSSLNNGEIVTVVGESNSCQTTSEGDTMIVHAQPVLTFSMGSPDTIICLNEEVVFYGSGAAEYEWQVNSTTIYGPDPVDTFAYSGLVDGDQVRLKGLSANSCAALSDTTFTFTVRPIPNVNLYSSSFDSIITKCETVDFTAIGADTFQFYIDGVAQGPFSTVNTFSTSSLQDGEVVSVVGKNSECPAPGNQEYPMTVNPLPALNLASNITNDTLCEAESALFTVIGAADDFEYFINGVSQGLSSSRDLNVTQLQDGDQIYAAGYTYGCPTYTDTVEVTVIPLPQVSLTSSAVPNNTICGGDTVVVRASGAQEYEFFLGGNSTGAASIVDSFVTASLNNTQTITARGYSFGCGANADTTFTYSVTSRPNVNFYSSSITNVICQGGNITFTALGSPEYEFFIDGISQGPLSPVNTFNAVFASADTFNVTVTATNNNCSSSSRDSFDVVVKPVPDVTLQNSDTDNTICDGDTVVFTAGGADQYRFLIDNISQGPFSSDTSFLTTQLQNGQTVKVEGLTNGCSAQSDSTYTFTVHSYPNLNLQSSVTGNFICEGDTLTFSAGGAQEYEFFVNGNSVLGPSPISMFSSDTFSTGAIIGVIGNSNGCTVYEESNNPVTVNSLPQVSLTISEIDTTICEGDNVTLTASGADLYEFFIDGASQGNPTTSTSVQVNTIQDGQLITAVGTSSSGCSSQASESYLFTVNQYPVVTLQNSISNEICRGTLVDFTASGADLYTFFVNGNPVAGPTNNNVYSTDSLTNGQSVSVVGESNSCAILSDSIYSYNVYNYPVVTLLSSEPGDSICNGEELVFTASGAPFYEFFVNGISQNPPSAVDSFVSNNLQTGDVVSVEGSVNMCSSSALDSFEYTVINYPQANMLVSSGGASICFGDTLEFTASNAQFYRFYLNGVSQGVFSTNNTFSFGNLENGDWVKLEAANYTCVAFSADSFQIAVDKMNLQLSSSLDANITCENEPVTFTASGADQYEFFVDGVSQGAPSASNSITLSNLQQGQMVNVRGTDFGTGCTMDSEFPYQMVVIGQPIITSLGGSEICDRDTIILSSNSPENNLWYLDGNLIEGETGQEISVFETGSYTLENYRGGNGNFAAVGANFGGQLGNGNRVNSRAVITSSEPDSLVQIDAGNDFNIALRTDGSVYTWGVNDYGQLGNSNFADKDIADEVNVLYPSMAVAAGHQHALAIRNNGQVYSWGRNDHGQLGNGSTTTSNFPNPVDTFKNIIDIAAGKNHSMYLRAGGSVWAWGDNTFGQLGNGNFTSSNLPVQVSGLPSNILSIAAGANFSMALAADSSVWAWGNNSEGQLGTSGIMFSSTPLNIGLQNIVQIDAGVVHALALRSDGRVYSWGGNNQGQLGLGNNIANMFVPVRVQSLGGVIELEAGAYSSFVIKHDRSVWGWGLNGFGQLGDSTVINKNEPAFIDEFTGAVQIAAGENHSSLIYGFSRACVSNVFTLQVDSNPVPQIINSWPTLSASSGATYQWYIDGIEIPGATDQVLSSLVDGVYTVEITYANGCSGISEAFDYVTSIQDIDADKDIKVWPNPNEGSFSVSLRNGNLELPERVELLNTSGKIVALYGKNHWNNNAILHIHQGNLASGLYFVKIIFDEQVFLKKVIINQ